MFKFLTVAFYIQMSHINIEDVFEKIKGNILSTEEKNQLNKRIKYVKKWLDLYASDKHKYELQAVKPIIQLNEEQLKFAKCLESSLKEVSWDHDAIFNAIQSVIKENDFVAKNCYESVYLLFLNKNHGPPVNWFLSSLDKNFVLERLSC